MKKDDGTYPITLRSSWVKEDLISRTFEFGQLINLIDDTYFENGRISRVLDGKLTWTCLGTVRPILSVRVCLIPA